MIPKKIISELEAVSKEYADLALPQIVFNYEKYKRYQVVGSSTRLEGATLTDAEVEVLLEQGRTAPGKLLEHHLMVRDNFRAMQHALAEAEKKTPVGPALLQAFNAHNIRRMENMVEALCATINNGLTKSKSLVEQLTCAFDAHSDLVMIHPWNGGNKRTSRLLMNYIERYFDLPLTMVHKEDVYEYLSGLKALKDNNDRTPFRTFMFAQHIKTLAAEIAEYRNHLSNGKASKNGTPKRRKM